MGPDHRHPQNVVAMSHELDEEFEVSTSERGMRLTTLCPVCHVQIFGYLFRTTIDDLVAHMNEFHTEGRPGHG